MNFKISSEPRLGPINFSKNKTLKVLFENLFIFELKNNIKLLLRKYALFPKVVKAFCPFYQFLYK